jgi:hypothetical protein
MPSRVLAVNCQQQGFASGNASLVRRYGANSHVDPWARSHSFGNV